MVPQWELLEIGKVVAVEVEKKDKKYWLNFG